MTEPGQIHTCFIKREVKLEKNMFYLRNLRKNIPNNLYIFHYNTVSFPWFHLMSGLALINRVSASSIRNAKRDVSKSCIKLTWQTPKWRGRAWGSGTDSKASCSRSCECCSKRSADTAVDPRAALPRRFRLCSTRDPSDTGSSAIHLHPCQIPLKQYMCRPIILGESRIDEPKHSRSQLLNHPMITREMSFFFEIFETHFS